MTPILEFRSVERSFKRNVPVLDGVSFAMQPGEVAGLLGRNGAGKTTLIRIAMGMLHPHGGSASVFGANPTEDPVAIKRRIGYVAEDQVLPPGSTIADLIAFHKYLFPRWDAALETQLLERFGLAPGSRIKHLSKGQARQAALLCAVCHRPELLLLDEPAGGLNHEEVSALMDLLREVRSRLTLTMLLVEHHMNMVMRVSDQVVALDFGRVIADGTPAQVQGNADVIRAYLGTDD